MPATTQHPIDKHVGRRIRLARIERDVTQPKLAEALGVAFQQVQKYECGQNRISASRLWLASRALGKSIQWFFEGYDG